MLPVVHCITSFLCVTLVSDLDPVIQQKQAEAKDLLFVNDLNRGNFKYLDGQAYQNLVFNLNKIASGVVTNVTFDLLSELSDEVDALTNGRWATSPCFVNVASDMAERVKLIVPEMETCVKEVHKKYQSFSQQAKEALEASVQNEMVLKNLSVKCDALSNPTECYVQNVEIVRGSAFEYAVMFEKVNDELHKVVMEDIPAAESCLLSYSAKVEEAAGPVRGASRACQSALIDSKAH